MMRIIIGSVFILLIVEYLIRTVMFRRGYVSRETFSAEMVSPVDGRIVYRRELFTNTVFMRKKKDTVMQILKKYTKYLHIGIYLSVYDRHWVCSPIDGEIVNTEVMYNNYNVSMINLWNYVKYYYFGITPKLNNCRENTRVAYHFKNGIKMIVISDKYIGSITNFVIRGDVTRGYRLCFVNRGSQVDLIIPYYLVSTVVRSVGAKLKIGDAIVRERSGVWSY